MLRVCGEWHPDALLCVGIAPLERRILREIGDMGVPRLSYSTDDPWNPTHREGWFIEVLPEYDFVYSTRKANLADFEEFGCRRVVHLPFGYCDSIIYREESLSAADVKRFQSDVAFCGGADRDRIPYLKKIIEDGFDLHLYGGYWDRYRATRAQNRGQVDVSVMRKVISLTKVALCLVRRANRDGSCMRTYEVPAMGTCMLTEDTDEHRDLFGEDGEAVVYFSSVSEMRKRLRWLLEHDDERRRVAEAGHRRIVDGHHTYCDRLRTMLEVVWGEI